jgi:hypothetical protein
VEAAAACAAEEAVACAGAVDSVVVRACAVVAVDLAAARRSVARECRRAVADLVVAGAAWTADSEVAGRAELLADLLAAAAWQEGLAAVADRVAPVAGLGVAAIGRAAELIRDSVAAAGRDSTIGRALTADPGSIAGPRSETVRISTTDRSTQTAIGETT